MEHNCMNLNDYDYKYDNSVIASYPLKKRDQSKLLIYKNGKITESKFDKLKRTPNKLL